MDQQKGNNIYQKQQINFPLDLQQFLQNQSKKGVLQVPLDFQFQPIQLITKQLTKLNNNYTYRILYLGPRWPNSLIFHKKYSKNEQNPYISNPYLYQKKNIQKYGIQLNKPIKSSVATENLYKIDNYKTAIYYRPFQGMNPTLRKQDQQLIFDSMFESGNLDCAIKINEKQYDLFLRIDSNTRGHTLWYYFSIKNGRLRKKITFNICNIMKMKNLYEKNMKPYIFSKKKSQLQNIKWRQDANNISFQQKKLRYDFVYQKIYVRKLATFTFQYEFQYQNDQVYFAYCVPYTYSNLLSQIKHLNKHDHHNNQILQIKQAGKSFMGLSIPILRITNPKSINSQKKVILCTGRIHPGQTNGSIVLEGLVKYLLSKDADDLRRQTIFIIIPMINPDGVVLGNYRTGVVGKDLNRLYSNKNKQLYPQISIVRNLVTNIIKKRSIYMFLDFHGHSQKKNVFAYGPAYSVAQSQYYKCKILPKMISKKSQMFRFHSCLFMITTQKKSTARAVMLQQFKIPYTYTIQSSNGFYYDSQSKITHQFNSHRWLQMGRIFGVAIKQYLKIIEQYQIFINMRKQRIIRRKKRRSEGRIKSKQGTQQQYTRQQFTIYPKSTQYLLSLLQEIKNEQKEKKMEGDSQKDSDDDDDLDDMQLQKRQQFYKYIFKDQYSLQSFDKYDKKQRTITKTQYIQNNQTKKILKYPDEEVQFFWRSYQKKPITPRRRIESPNRNKNLIKKQIKNQLNETSLKSEKNQSQQKLLLFQDQPLEINLDYNQNSVDMAYQNTLIKLMKIQQQKKVFNKFEPKVQKRQLSARTTYNKSVKKPLSPNVVLATQHIFNTLTMQHNPHQIFTVPSMNKPQKKFNERKGKSSIQKYKYSQTSKQRQFKGSISHQKSERLIVSQTSVNQPLQFNFTKFLKVNQQNYVTSQKKDKSYKGFKAVFPSAFYRIKQQISGRKKQQVFLFESEAKNLSLHIKRLN